MANVAALRRELEWIKNNPKSWNQGSWMTLIEDNPELNACKTRGCLAGNAAVHAGLVERVVNTYTRLNGEKVEYAELRPLARFDVDQLREPWAVAGQEALGLTYMEAMELFEGSNSLWKLYSIANEITGGEIEIPADIVEDHPCESCGELVTGEGDFCTDCADDE